MRELIDVFQREGLLLLFDGLIGMHVCMWAVYEEGKYLLGRMPRHASSLSGEGGCLNLSSMVKVLDMGPGGAVVYTMRIFVSYDLYGKFLIFNFAAQKTYSRRRGLL